MKRIITQKRLHSLQESVRNSMKELDKQVAREQDNAERMVREVLKARDADKKNQ